MKYFYRFVYRFIDMRNVFSGIDQETPRNVIVVFIFQWFYNSRKVVHFSRKFLEYHAIRGYLAIVCL